MASSTIIPVYGFSNSFIVKGERAIIIDTGILQQHKKILTALEVNGIGRDQVSLIVLTHGHGDHYGCLKPLKDALGAPVMCGWPDAEYVEKGDSAPVVPVDMKGHIMKLFTGAKADPCRVDVVAKEDMDLKAYGVDARVLTTPGHTKGSISVLASDGGCVTGDLIASLVFKNSIGRSPFAEAPGMIGPSLKKIIDGGARYFYPGHGNRWDATDVSKKFASLIK